MSATGRGVGLEFRSYEGYLVGSDGRVYTTYRTVSPRPLAEGQDRDGYRTVQVKLCGKYATKCVHRLVAAVFLPP